MPTIQRIVLIIDIGNIISHIYLYLWRLKSNLKPRISQRDNIYQVVLHYYLLFLLLIVSVEVLYQLKCSSEVSFQKEFLSCQ